MNQLQKFIEDTPMPSTNVEPSAVSLPNDEGTQKRQSRFRKYMDPTEDEEQEISELDRYVAHVFPELQKDDGECVDSVLWSVIFQL